MELQTVCDRLVDETDGLLACVVLDLETGLALSQACRPGVDAAAVEKSTRVAGSMFRGRLVRQFAQSLATVRPGNRQRASARSVDGFVHEAQITTASTYQFMSMVPGWRNALLLMVTDRTLSIGLGWMAVHDAFAWIAQARPGVAQAVQEGRPRYATTPAEVPEEPAAETSFAEPPSAPASPARTAPQAAPAAPAEPPIVPVRETPPASQTVRPLATNDADAESRAHPEQSEPKSTPSRAEVGRVGARGAFRRTPRGSRS